MNESHAEVGTIWEIWCWIKKKNQYVVNYYYHNKQIITTNLKYFYCGIFEKYTLKYLVQNEIGTFLMFDNELKHNSINSGPLSWNKYKIFYCPVFKKCTHRVPISCCKKHVWIFDIKIKFFHNSGLKPLLHSVQDRLLPPLVWSTFTVLIIAAFSLLDKIRVLQSSIYNDICLCFQQHCES